MKIDLILGRELSSDLLNRWDQIARSVPELSSPYFRPEFTQAVAAQRDNVEIGILHDGDVVAGFFPFERIRRCIARPVGNRLSDYQAVIAPSKLPWQIPVLMRGCRLRAWEFDHHLASQPQLQKYVAKTSNSWRINVSAGFETYMRAARPRPRTGFLQRFANSVNCSAKTRLALNGTPPPKPSSINCPSGNRSNTAAPS